MGCTASMQSDGTLSFNFASDVNNVLLENRESAFEETSIALLDLLSNPKAYNSYDQNMIYKEWAYTGKVLKAKDNMKSLLVIPDLLEGLMDFANRQDNKKQLRKKFVEISLYLLDVHENPGTFRKETKQRAQDRFIEIGDMYVSTVNYIPLHLKSVDLNSHPKLRTKVPIERIKEIQYKEEDKKEENKEETK